MWLISKVLGRKTDTLCLGLMLLCHLGQVLICEPQFPPLEHKDSYPVYFRGLLEDASDILSTGTSTIKSYLLLLLFFLLFLFCSFCIIYFSTLHCSQRFYVLIELYISLYLLTTYQELIHVWPFERIWDIESF